LPKDGKYSMHASVAGYHTGRYLVLCIMVSDLTKLRQMLLNLLSNAVKFTHGGQIELSVRRGFVNDSEVVTFQISDTGIGMSPEQISRLFETFMQGDESNTRKYGGTGLGLALSQRLCRLMGGEISVVSQLNLGSTFIATLPVDLAAYQPKFDPPEQILVQHSERPRRQPRLAM
jgi:signal transduction histidine kinase